MTYTYLSTLLLILILFVTELLYFRIANKFQITDKPNHRSSHSVVTIRGGGIIFPLAVFLHYILAKDIHNSYLWFVLGLFSISTISFWDDITPLSNKFRLSVQTLAVILLYTSFTTHYPIWLLLIGGFLMIGFINVFNFMDGINGITGLYSLSFVITALWLNNFYSFTNHWLLIFLLSATVIFLFFNFRKKAICFAGDVGSISMAFIICYLLASLIIKSNNCIYLGFLIIYGLDAISTIVFRLIRKENIFKAHRSHFYQFLVNEKKISALWVSAGYALTQLVINLLLIVNFKDASTSYNLLQLFSICILLFAVFVYLRLNVEGKERLCKLNTSVQS